MHPSIRSQLIRALLTSVDDSGAQQILQVTGLAGQQLARVVRSQHFGLSSNPPADAEGLLLAMGGGFDRAHGLGFEHPQHRPTNLPSGAVALYDSSGNLVQAQGGKIFVKPKDNTVNVYIGGDGATGTYAPLATVSGPCLSNILGRIA